MNVKEILAIGYSFLIVTDLYSCRVYRGEEIRRHDAD